MLVDCLLSLLVVHIALRCLGLGEFLGFACWYCEGVVWFDLASFYGY